MAHSTTNDNHQHHNHHDAEHHHGHDHHGHATAHELGHGGKTHDHSGMAVSATLHCLTGCAVGEILGLIIGTHFGFPPLGTTALAVTLAFLFGYALSILPLLRGGIQFGRALRLVLLADTLSILTMEIVDNGIMLAIPGAMDSGVSHPLFWGAMAVALTVAFFVAWPVNRALLKRGKGHAITHEALGHHDTSNNLLYGLIGLLLGGFIASAGMYL